MANSSLLHFSVSQLSQAPFYTKTRSTVHTSSLYSHLIYSKSMSSFLFSTSLHNSRISFKHSNFNHLLSPAIIVNSMRMHDSTITSTVVFNNEKVLNIDHCYFYKVSAVQHQGGALCVDGLEECQNFTLTNSGFFNCRSSLSGGAMYIRASFTVLARNCFFRCHSEADCMSAYISASIYDPLVQLNFTSVHLCAESADLGKSKSLGIENGIPANLININCSFNSVSQLFASLSFFNIRQLDIHYLDVSSCSSFYVFQLSLCSNSFDFMDANFHNNSGRGGSVIHAHMVNPVLSKCCFSKNKDCKIIELYESSSVTFEECLFDTDLSSLSGSVVTKGCKENVPNLHPASHQFIETYVCWDQAGVENSEKGWWNLSSKTRALILSLGVAIIFVGALFGRRAFDCRMPRLKMRDTVSLKSARSDSSSLFVVNQGSLDTDINYEVI